MTAIKFSNKLLSYLDQTQLPLKEIWKKCDSFSQGYTAIKKLEVRGAPLIGVFAAYCAALEINKISTNDKKIFLNKSAGLISELKKCRPTAINLAWALTELKNSLVDSPDVSIRDLKKNVIKKALDIHKQDQALCDKMAKFGAALVRPDDIILTHCNAGFLATGGNGTALGVIYEAAKKYKNLKVYADETRPLLQGSRLTAWELLKAKIDVTLICDNMAAYLMSQGKITKIFVGADRIAANGDTANKIGTYSVAVCAKYHKIPFYVVAPFSTFDLTIRSGKGIPIEERDHNEVRKVFNRIQTAPLKVKAYNPAFDVTPSDLISAIITDKGIVTQPYMKNIKRLLGK